jgi:hypothetical protein
MSATPVPIEMVPTHDTSTDHRRTLVWGDHNSGSGMVSSHDWHFSGFGRMSDAALTLARTGSAIFLADRAVRRNELRQRREINLIVKVPDPALGAAAASSLQLLAGFVTGDEWHIEFEPDECERDSVPDQHFEAGEVSLLSGGLDSFCGALIGGVDDRLFLSHSDATVIKYSQNQAIPWIPGFDVDKHVEVRLAARAQFNREPSRRSRSILFMTLGVALADAAGATALEVPENGFTSLNPPLASNRGGVLTTRSTHPYTFHLANAVLADLELNVALRNPYEWTTKGELVALAVNSAGESVVQSGMARTLSCAKTNLVMKGKTFGRNCGLDYACIVRRAGILAAGIDDTTTYECDTPGLEQLIIDARRKDIAAVRLAQRTLPSVASLAANCGPFPPGYDLDLGLDLWNRAHRELRDLPLP